MARRMRAGPSGHAMVHFQPFAQPAAVSGAQSRGVLAFVNQALRGWGLPGVSEYLLRKAAHFAEFMVLGWWMLLCTRAFAARVARWMPWLWGAGILCAAADEGIQFFLRAFPTCCSTAAVCWRVLCWHGRPYGRGHACTAGRKRGGRAVRFQKNPPPSGAAALRGRCFSAMRSFVPACTAGIPSRRRSKCQILREKFSMPLQMLPCRDSGRVI